MKLEINPRGFWSAVARHRFESGDMSPHSKWAFSLIELLVVVTLIVVLLALLTPALDKAIESAVRAKCAAHQHGLLNVFNTYAADQGHRKYPTGIRNDGGEHGWFVSTAVGKMVTQYSGNNKSTRASSVGIATAWTGAAGVAGVKSITWGNTPEILVDPAYKDFGGQSDWGYLIGFHYLGGHPGITKANDHNPQNVYNDVKWESPMGIGKEGSGDLIACLNQWGSGQTLTTFANAPHAANGPLGEDTDVMAYWYTASAQDVKYLGAQGGNVGHADGSVGWKKIDDMKIYLPSIYGTDYWARW